MAFPNINEFKERLLDGGARPSLFTMQITWPLALQQAQAQKLMPFHCRVAEIPGTSVNPITVKYAGREIKYSGQRVYSNLSVTILNDEGFTIRKALEAWFESMSSRATNVSALVSPTFAGYGGVGVVTQFDKRGSAVRAYTFQDMFPVSLSPIALSWDNDAAIEDYTCEFAYQYWTDSPAADGLAAGVGAI